MADVLEDEWLPGRSGSPAGPARRRAISFVYFHRVFWLTGLVFTHKFSARRQLDLQAICRYLCYVGTRFKPTRISLLLIAGIWRNQRNVARGTLVCSGSARRARPRFLQSLNHDARARRWARWQAWSAWWSLAITHSPCGQAHVGRARRRRPGWYGAQSTSKRTATDTRHCLGTRHICALGSRASRTRPKTWLTTVLNVRSLCAEGTF